MGMQSINVQVAVQLWQVILAIFTSSAALLALGYGAARTFVGRKECQIERGTSEEHWNDLYTIVRGIKEDVAYLKGQLDK